MLRSFSSKTAPWLQLSPTGPADVVDMLWMEEILQHLGPWIVKTLQKMGQNTYQLMQDVFHPL